MRINKTFGFALSAIASAFVVAGCGGSDSSPAPLTAQTIAVAAAKSTVFTTKTTTLSSSGGSGTGAVTYSVTSGTCTISSGNTLTAPSTAGSCVVTATKAADATYASATANVTVTIAALPVFSTGFNTAGKTVNGGDWYFYNGGSPNGAFGFADGRFVNGTGAQLAANADDSFAGYYQVLTAGNLTAPGYSYAGNAVTYPGTTGLSFANATALKYKAAVDANWFASSGGAKFVVMIATQVSGVSTATCDPKVAAVVTATASAMTQYSTPLSDFAKVAQDCGTATVTAAQILAGAAKLVSFEVDAGGAAVTSAGRTSNGYVGTIALLNGGVISFE